MVSRHLAYVWRCLATALPWALWLTATANAAGTDLAECGLKPNEPGTIVAADSTGDLSLQDGRKLKLAGVRIAASPNPLADLVGQTIVPYPAAKGPDRTGFTPAHILLSAETDNQPPVWLQQKLLQQGNAFIYIYPDQISCASALRSSEETARQSGTGIWNLDLLHPTPISIPKDTQSFFLGTAGHFDADRAVGHYGIIRGLVLSTGSAGRWRYLNFGRNYTEDFTVRLTANVEKRLSEHGFTLKGLKDRTIEVRGIVQSNGGPLVDVFDTAQIVIME
ncbi:hypothetical protein [Pararhizobium sp. IMCC21322]|uniref:hypothetical protein n=1 Tax=Pararhizobium sp. IMCC21322 TaxID=3067903 RepID=UPI0027412861|nr:hypothetical protein [Pararhizobium sp. IMCC21322]